MSRLEIDLERRSDVGKLAAATRSIAVVDGVVVVVVSKSLAGVMLHTSTHLNVSEIDTVRKVDDKVIHITAILTLVKGVGDTVGA